MKVRQEWVRFAPSGSFLFKRRTYIQKAPNHFGRVLFLFPFKLEPQPPLPVETVVFAPLCPALRKTTETGLTEGAIVTGSPFHGLPPALALLRGGSQHNGCGEKQGGEYSKHSYSFLSPAGRTFPASYKYHTFCETFSCLRRSFRGIGRIETHGTLPVAPGR